MTSFISRVSLQTTIAAVLIVLMLGAASYSMAQAGWDGGSDEMVPLDGMSQNELASLVAPIALYPDGLLGQVLVACTYPDEVVQAQ